MIIICKMYLVDEKNTVVLLSVQVGKLLRWIVCT